MLVVEPSRRSIASPINSPTHGLQLNGFEWVTCKGLETLHPSKSGAKRTYFPEAGSTGQPTKSAAHSVLERHVQSGIRNGMQWCLFCQLLHE